MLAHSDSVAYRARQKSNPLGKIRHFWDCSKFFSKLTKLTEEDSHNIFFKFRWNICLRSKNYTKLNLNVHLSK